VRQTNKYLDSVSQGMSSPRKLCPAAWLGRGSPEHTGFPLTTAGMTDKWHDLRATFSSIFGVFGSDATEYQARRKKLGTTARGVDAVLVEKLIADRSAARKAKDFALADALKKQLLDLGIEFKDKPDGTTEWKIR